MTTRHTILRIRIEEGMLVLSIGTRLHMWFSSDWLQLWNLGRYNWYDITFAKLLICIDSEESAVDLNVALLGMHAFLRYEYAPALPPDLQRSEYDDATLERYDEWLRREGLGKENECD